MAVSHPVCSLYDKGGSLKLRRHRRDAGPFSQAWLSQQTGAYLPSFYNMKIVRIQGWLSEQFMLFPSSLLLKKNSDIVRWHKEEILVERKTCMCYCTCKQLMALLCLGIMASIHYFHDCIHLAMWLKTMPETISVCLQAKSKSSGFQKWA